MVGVDIYQCVVFTKYLPFKHYFVKVLWILLSFGRGHWCWRVDWLKSAHLHDLSAASCAVGTASPELSRVGDAREVTRIFWTMLRTTLSQKNIPLYFWLLLRQMLTDLQNSFTDRINGKFTIKSLWNIPPHLRYVTTLPCEIFLFRNCLFVLKNMSSKQSSGTWDTCVCLTRFVASKQPRPKPSLLQNLGRNAATCLPDKSPGCERLEATSD